MIKKLYLLPLLGGAYLSGMSSLIAMEEQEESSHIKVTTPPSLKLETQLEEKSLTLLPLEKASLDEIIGEIDQYLEQSIAYSQKTLNIVDGIYNLYIKKRKIQAREDFNMLYGQNVASRNDTDFHMDIMRMKKMYEAVIYNATTFRRDLFETLDGEFKYPRTAVGAALLSAAAGLEEKEHKSSKALNAIEAIESPLAEHLSRLHNDEILFYEYIMRLIHPYWIQEHERNAVAFGQQVKKQNDTYKAKNDIAVRKAKELELAKRKEENKRKHRKNKKPNKKNTARNASRAQGGSSLSIISPTHQGNKPPISVSDKLNSEKEGPTMLPIMNTLVREQEAIEIKNAQVLELQEQAIPPLKKEFAIPMPFEDHQVKDDLSRSVRDDFKKKQKPNALVSKPRVPAFDISCISLKHKGLLSNIFSSEKNFEKIAWNDVQSMMKNAFNGKMYGAKGGSKRQFAIFLREQIGEPTNFVTVDEYNNYLKECRKNKKFDYTIVRKVVHTEEPHSRGASTKGKTRFMYPTLVELLASSLEKVGLTPQNLGW